MLFDAKVQLLAVLRELKVLLVAWFDGLASILSKVEEIGVWPDGLLDAYIAMIPKTDGGATHLGQRPLRVLGVVYRIWASARMVQLEDWFRSWVPDSVCSAGGGRGSVEAWYATALDIEEVLLTVTYFLLLMILSPLTPWIVVLWIGSWAVWGCLIVSHPLVPLRSWRRDPSLVSLSASLISSSLASTTDKKRAATVAMNSRNQRKPNDQLWHSTLYLHVKTIRNSSA